MSAVRALARVREAGVELRPGAGGALRVLARPGGVPPPLLDALRLHKPALLALLALLRGEACRRCGVPIADRGPDAWVPFADGTAAHLACEDRWHVEDALRRAGNALSAEARADEAELTVRGELG